ncbi:MAG: hypothetical protein L7H18_02700 [Candidatus Nealsonbacteria bacterium DGGOD1a]|nr:MAG: hypothetical protein L7H18_02700 [Candidatus Nealsonbacteria bacterium DGGOD1a]
MDEIGELRPILFIPGFLRDEETVARVSQILEQVQPVFNEAGWKIVVSNYYQGEPMDNSLEIYARSVYADIFYGKYRTIIAHSMGGLLIPEKLPRQMLPPVIIESPLNGVTMRQFKIINLLARLKGLGKSRFPLDNISVQGMLRNGDFMENRRTKNFPWMMPMLQINGSLGTNFLARWDGDTFGKHTDCIGVYKEFPKIDHIALLTDPDVIKAVIAHLNRWDDKYDALSQRRIYRRPLEDEP